MANSMNEAIEFVYEARDYAAKEYVVKDLSEFLSNWAESALHTTPLGDIEQDIVKQMPGLLAEFAGWMMVGLCNSKDVASATIQARFHEMFESGMCEAPVMLWLNTRTPEDDSPPFADEVVDQEPYGPAYYQTFQDLRELVKDKAPTDGPTWFVDLMASIEIAIDELAGQHKFLG